MPGGEFEPSIAPRRKSPANCGVFLFQAEVVGGGSSPRCRVAPRRRGSELGAVPLIIGHPIRPTSTVSCNALGDAD